MTDINSALQIFRGINAPLKTSTNNNSTIIDEAENFKEDNKSEITTTLEDFMEKFNSFHGENSSNITAKDAKKGFFASLFNSDDKNVFETENSQKYLEEKENYYQKDIFSEAVSSQGGIKYQNGDLYDSALNFAKADIGAIEGALNKVYDSGAKVDDKLNYAEIKSYFNSDDIEGIIKTLNLDDDDKTISAEEYASYLIAADGLTYINDEIGTQYLESHADGLIDEENASLALDYSKIKETAEEIYKNHYEN